MRALSLTYALSVALRCGVLLLLLVGGLGMFVVFTTSPPAPVEPTPKALEPVTMSMPDFGAPPGGPLVMRPLFWESRTPYVPPESAVEEEIVQVQQGTILDAMKLVGVLGTDEDGVIIVQIEGRRRRIQLNESVDGWELVSVSANQATFRGTAQDGDLEEQVLPLKLFSVSQGEAAPSVRARFAPARPGMAVENVETEGGSDVKQASSESVEPSSVPAESESEEE